MSQAPILTVGTTLAVNDDTWFHVFQTANAPASPLLLAGNFFLGLQAYTAVRVPMGSFPSLGLARGGTIETGLINAAVSFTAAGAWTAGGTIEVTCLLDDTPRRASDAVPNGDTAVVPYDARLAAKPDGGFGPAWRRDLSGIFDARLEDTGGTPFVDLGLGNFGNFAIGAITGHRVEMAQVITVTGGPWSVARVILELRRFGLAGSPSTMEVAIQGSQSDGFGHIEPDGVDLGVSASVLNTTIPLSPATGPITYAFTPDVVLADGTYWVVLRQAIPYPILFLNFVVWMQRRAFLGPGGSHRTDLDTGFGIGNYPGAVDVQLDLAAKELGPAIIWNPIARVFGQSVSTPDLSPLVEEVIRNSGHENNHALIFVFRTAGETRTYRFASNEHATLNPPGFACQYRRRDIRGEVI